MESSSDGKAKIERLQRAGTGPSAKDGDQPVFTWHGCAHFHIQYKGRKIITDPLYHRPPGDTPHLQVSKEAVDRVDYLLLTHAHMDHSWDFPYLASKHAPLAYAPEKYLDYLQRKAKRWGLSFNPTRLHGLESAKGHSFSIEDVEVTPYQIGTEEIDFWFIRTCLVRPWRHFAFSAMPAGNKFLMHHLKDNCFGYHFRFSASGLTLFYIGNLTDQVDELAAVERVNILAIPYCPANKKWLAHTRFLIGRFAPDVVFVHHYDNFWHPYTHQRYRNLRDYQEAVWETHPRANIQFAKFMEPVGLMALAGAGQSQDIPFPRHVHAAGT